MKGVPVSQAVRDVQLAMARLSSEIIRPNPDSLDPDDDEDDPDDDPVDEPGEDQDDEDEDEDE